MVNAERLLEGLKKLRKKLEADLRHHHVSSAGRAAIEAEWQEARDTKRTADTFETFFGAAVDQATVHWILALVFLRFLEDNGLLDHPLVSGAGERLELAQLRQREHFRAHPTDSDAEYLLAMFGEAARLPGLSGLYDPAPNPLFRLPVSGDGAKELFDFFRQRVAGTAALVHDFADPDWNTRFLGDLYQYLSEEARKRFALLQTPDFVEAWILSRTLDPAIREFGHEQVRMIDPACGSGHFLLSGFARLLAEWTRHAPEMPQAAQVQKALDAVGGVDLNPFAVEIARFRLLVAALKGAGVQRLAAAPDFRFQLATGDSLLHGRHFARHELGGAEEGFRRVLRHHYAAEDADAVNAILGRQYHAVVGNPPYITPKDAAMRYAYREIYDSCHMKYGLGAPFTERFFDLAEQGTRDQAAGFVGLIVANSFMKREFGRKLIQDVLPRLDLTHIVDTSGAYIPGHGTPTAILFGRNRTPVAQVVRTVRGVGGEPTAPEIPKHGLVWSAIVGQTDLATSESDFISTEDTERAALARHPWNMGGGGASEVQAAIEDDRPRLAQMAAAIGVFGMTNADEVMLADTAAFRRTRCEPSAIRSLVVGDQTRDWRITEADAVIFPYDESGLLQLDQMPMTARWLWLARTVMGNRATFSQRTYFDEGRPWWEWHQTALERLGGLTITFPFVATHNHFVLDRGKMVFGRTAPIIKLPAGASEDEHLGVLGLLNSSTARFWMKNVLMDRGNGGIGGGIANEPWERFYEHDGGKIGRFPLAADRPVDLARALDNEARQLGQSLLVTHRAIAVPTQDSLTAARADAVTARARMIALQEELDWRCYGLYGLRTSPPQHTSPPPLRLGERAFEILMARRMAAEELETAWFDRHCSTPITDLPTHWPDDYRATVERRIALIESDPTIGMVERPEYKRRWSSESWETIERNALRAWLLDRLEDARFWDAADTRIVTSRSLADSARADTEFQAVAELYVGRGGFDLEALMAELVAAESVPFLAALRYSETGLRKRADWEAAWEKQRAEDAIDEELAGRRDKFLRAAYSRQNARGAGEAAEAYASRMAVGLGAETVQQAADTAIAAETKRRKATEVGDIPVPPKYKSADFQSASFWGLRGGLDVPKERFVSFPHCARDADPSLPILWAGHDHLARARALASLYVERRDTDGWPSARLLPMLAGLLELVPWLRQWHNEIDAETGLRMGDYFAGFIEEEARERGLTIDDLRNWTPPAPARRTRARRTTA
ncbi:BREX-2 system adenine-specific DNA-methyltransferase PglX [Lichenicoccus sp.]|uniref:BREX-2 system adenine-specific DNA-methyltransferase PglX n=1 Tax=Lichenicoccus sp. TaxID=2781899 RepID=UPI003D0D62EE